MKYQFNTSFQQLDDNNKIVGLLDIHSHVETKGYFNNGIEIYKAMLISLIQSMEQYECAEVLYGK